MAKYPRRKAYKKRAPYKRRAVKRSKSSFAKKVTAVIQRKAEHKMVVNATSNYMPNYLVGTPLQIQLTPNATTLVISQTDTQSGRTGNRVRTVSCKIKGIMYPTGYSNTQNSAPSPQDIRMVISRNRVNPTQAPAFTNFYQIGAGSQAPTGTLIDSILPVNRDVQTVYSESRTFKLGNASYDGSSFPSLAGAQFYANNDYKMSHKFSIDVTKYIPKTIIWNDANDLPTTPSTWMTLMATEALNAGAPGGNQKCAMFYSIVYTYTDF